MDFVELLSLPVISFAHIYQADTYSNRFPSTENFLEIAYIAEGSLHISLENEEICAKKGDVLCVRCNTKKTVSADAFHCHHTVGVKIAYRFTEDKHGLLLPYITPASSNTETIYRLIDDFIHNQIEYKESKALGAAKFLELLCAIDKCNRKAADVHSPAELLYAKRAKDYIQKNIHACITQNSIAAQLGICPEYLCAVFKKTEGTTVMKYINKLKLENIKALMDHSGMPLYEAAAIYGYHDPNYVSRLYKQLFGYNVTAKLRVHPEIQ